MQLRRVLVPVLLLSSVIAVAQSLPPDDAVRIAEFYRLADQIQDKVWKEWSRTPAPLLLVTDKQEFLTHSDITPDGFTRGADGVAARPRTFPTHLLATFPAFGPPSAIVIGEPANTDAKTSTPWLIIAMHEHFHQLQNAQPGYFDKVNGLGLARGDKSGMWMLNYPFPYEDAAVREKFDRLRGLLLKSLSEQDEAKFKQLAAQYVKERKAFSASLTPDDRKYFEFQVWQEGIARYTQVKVAETAAGYEPSKEFAALADFISFADEAKNARVETLSQLQSVNLATAKRGAFYPFGAAEGFLLDRFRPQWNEKYFEQMFSMEPLFK